jgi:Predicted glycosyltransferases
MPDRRISTNNTHINAHIYIRTRATGSFRTADTPLVHPLRQQAARAYADAPFLSVIICTYNRRNMVLTALASLRKQTLTYAKFEVIIVDNGSSDGTYNAVQTYLHVDHASLRFTREPLRVQCLREERNGLAHARNTGLAVANGEVVVFLDDDIIAQPQFLEQLYRTYCETDADAVGGSVDLHWEAPRPYWLSDYLLDTFGLYKPLKTRSRMPTGVDFSNSCFSVRRSTLQNIGAFSPFLSKRLHMPISVEANDLCRRLRQAGYQLWYEPTAQVLHRISQARLERAFMLGRAYWQGRSEILADYADTEQYQDAEGSSLFQTLHSLLPEIGELLRIMLIHRLLLYLARKPMSERLYAAMAQSRCWGRIHQQFMLSNHAPATSTIPNVLVVRAQADDATPLALAIQRYGASCTTSIAHIPLTWLWRHRAHQEMAIGLIHLYRPGAFQTGLLQQLSLLFKLCLARYLGICITSTDAGGWWQYTHQLRGVQQRLFERCVFAHSQLIHTFVRRPEHFYADTRWRERVCFLAHPGLRGTLPALEVAANTDDTTRAAYANAQRSKARTLLGIPVSASFVYLCFAHLHTEHEVLQLIEAFSTMNALYPTTTPLAPPQLVLVGMPSGKRLSQQILQQAAYNSALHLFMQYHQKNLATYVAATDAIVMPYCTVKSAGLVDLAMLFYSYERLIIVPDLPRFYGLLPPYAKIQYIPSNILSLVQALLTAQKSMYQHTERETMALNGERGWTNYVKHMMDIYKQLLILKEV